MAIRVFLIDTQDVIATAAMRGLAEAVPRVCFETFEDVGAALQRAVSADRVVVCAPYWRLTGADAARWQDLLARQPRATLMMIRGSDDVPALYGVLERLVAEEAPRQGWVAPAAGQPRLSEREMQILLLLREGLQNKVIARRLDLSVSTVKTHVANLFRKMGAGNRLDAICKFTAMTRAEPVDEVLSFRQPVAAPRLAAVFAH